MHPVAALPSFRPAGSICADYSLRLRKVLSARQVNALSVQRRRMQHSTWTEAEKKIARRVFNAALQRELVQVMAEFKRRAAGASDPDDIWSVQEYLAETRRQIDTKYDFRYSQLLIVFGRLLRENRIEEGDLTGLSDEKLRYVRSVASL